MKRQLSLLLALSVGVGAVVFACSDDETETTPTGVTATGTMTGTTPTGSTPTGTTPAGTTPTGTTPSGGAGGGSSCQDADQPAYAGTAGGPFCYNTGGQGGYQMAPPQAGYDAPNDSAQAVHLGVIGDPDDCGGVIHGVINGPDDVDWYTYYGSDEWDVIPPFEIVDPHRDRGTDNSLVICAYILCAGDDPVGPPDGVECSAGSSTATLGSGGAAPIGCCTDGNATVLDVETGAFDACSLLGFGNDDQIVYISVSGHNLGANACVDYDLQFNF